MHTDKSRHMRNIQKLVGDIFESDLKYVDCYSSENFGIFIPSVGYCQYAIKPSHTHPSYSMILFFSEDQAIMPATIKIMPNHYLVAAIGPEVHHEEKEMDTFTRYVAIFITKETYESIYANYCQTPPETYLWKQFQIEHDIMINIKKYISEYENKLPGADSLLEIIGIEMTHQFIRSILKINISVDSITDKFEIQRSIEFIHQYFGEKLSIPGLAKIANMSQSHFMRVFKMETGLSPMEYLIQLRISNAKKLLRSRVISITEVALQCGFNSISHFSASFTRHTGMKPSEYQKLYGG